jgi:tetratricopeptide (TPR) repeat protein
MDVLREVIALRQAGDVQASLALVDRSLAEGMSSNYLLDNRARALAQLNRENEAIQIWEFLSECGDLELQEKSKRLVKLARQQQCRFVLQHSVYLSHSGHAHEALAVLDRAQAEGIENDMLLDNRFQQKCRYVLNRVVYFSRLGDAHEALAILDLAQAEGIENDMLLDNRARIFVKLNRHIEAISIWKKLSQSDPKKYNAILINQLVGALQLICRSQGWNVQYFNRDLETLDALEKGVLKECELLRKRGYAQPLIQLVDKALESGFESPWLVIAKANALIELEKFVDAQNLLNHFKDSVHEQHALAAMEQMLDALSGDVEVELVVRAAVRLKAKGDLDAAQDLLVKALLQNHSCVVYEETLQQLLVERGEKNPALQAFELFLGEAEKMQTAALISGQ